MKKVLSLLLAVVMVIGICPTFLFSAFASSSEGAESEPETFPELVITEIYANAINYQANASTWLKNWPKEAGFYSAPQPGEPYYLSLREFKAGEDLPGSTYKKVTAEDGTVSFELASGAAEAGASYFQQFDTSNYYDSFQYMEIYNSGTTAVNLYDYKLVHDSSATYNESNPNGNPLKINEIKPGNVKSSYRRDGFERIALDVGTPLDGYYTKKNETFVPCAAGAVAEEGVEYYHTFGEDGTYFVTNPDEAILQPGQCAVLWFYTDIDQICGAKMSYFRQFFEYDTAGKAYHLDMSNTMVLCVESNDLKNLSGYAWNASVNFNIVLGNHVRYGIVPGDYENRLDNDYNNWISSVRWDCYAGFNETLAVTRASVVVGETVVTSGYFYRDEQTGYYTLPLKKSDKASDERPHGVGCNDDGTAKDGVAYYKIKLANTNYAPTGSNSPVSHKLDRTSTNFLYGFDSDLSPKEGAAYTVSQYDNTPGMLTEVQKATLPNGVQKTSAPKLVITEVMPDSEGADQFEYVEVVNTSGETINIFDYTFVARTSSYMASANEFFNKANPLIPGDVGNILSAEPGSVFNDVVPTNIDYKSGWLEPGETVVLWSYYSDSAKRGATFDDFYNYYNLDRSVKVIAMDSDNSAYSGRALRQNLGNSGSYLYGLVANSNLDFYGEVYKSNPVMKPITYANGVTAPNNTGIPISDCESFVAAACVFATCSSAPGLGENYGYQYIWNKNPGVNNKCGAYYSYARLTQMSNDSKFSFTGSVVTEEWKASPGKLLPRQKTELTTNTGKERYVLYTQDFENLGTVSGYEAVAKLLGISAYGEETNATLAGDHNANVAATENGGNSLLEIKDGKLYVKNRGTADEYLRLMSDDILKTYRKTNFTIEYSMTYGEGSPNGNGYSAILFDFDAAKMSYGEPAIRISGYGSNSVYLNGVRSSVEDDSSTPHAAPSMSATSGKGTLYELLTGNAPEGTLQNSGSLAGVTVKVRIEVSYTNGVTVYVNDTEVSETKRAASSKVFADWAFFLEESNGSDLALKITPETDVAYDYIMVYSDTLGTNATDMDIPSLFLTEIVLNGGTQIYKPNTSSTTNLSWLEYMELTNGSDQPVSLMDYTLVRNYKEVSGSLETTYSHQGNNRTWEPRYAYDNYNVAKLSDWLGKDDQKAKISYSAAGLNTDASVYNPSENEAVLQPGESIIILTLNEGNSEKFYKKDDRNGENVNIIDATRSWLNLPSTTKVMVIGQARLYKSVGNSAPEQLNTAFAMWDTDSYVYGVARNKGTYYDGTEYELNPDDWQNVYTHDYRKLESLLDLNMSVAFGQNNNNPNDSDYGTGGDSVAGAGWVAYYLYGNDNSMHYKYGVAMSRRNTRPLTVYKSNSTSVASAGDYNAGYLLAAQRKSFEEMNKLRNNGYKKDASLVLTEFIPGTTDDRGGTRNAFEAAEVTNIGATPVNLYNYALVESPVVYGCTGVWSVMNPFTAGTPVGQNHKWYNRVKYLKNPDTCIVEPGESVVIWNFYKDAYNLADVAPKRDYISVEDFRNFWESQGNTLINQYDLVEEAVTNADGTPMLDENGNPVTRTVKKYKVKVIVVVGNDGGITPSFNFANNGTASLGICRKNTISVSGSIRAADVLSYTTNPLHSVIFNLAITRTQITRYTYPYQNTVNFRGWKDEEIELQNFDGILYAGDPVNGYYTSENCRDFTPCGELDVAEKGKYYYELQEDGTYLPIPVNENISVADLFVKVDDLTFRRATGTHAGRTYTQVSPAAGEFVSGLFMQTFVDIYTQCAEGALAVANTTYYAYADGAYTEVAVETGTSLDGLYTKSEAPEYTLCGEGAVAAENVTYYQKNGTTYTVVENIVAGETDVSAYYTMAMKDVYTACGQGVATAGVTYYRKNADTYTAVEGVVVGETDISAYYTKNADDTYTACGSGVAAEGVTYYQKTEGDYTETEVKTPTDVSAYFTKRTEERKIACAEGAVAEEGKVYYSAEITQYYKLYCYVNQQTMNANDEGLNWAFNFVYGTSFSGSWSIGSVLQTTKIASRTKGGKTTYAKKPNFTPKISTDILARGARRNSLGYLIEEQLGMVATLRFTETAALADGTRVYLYDTVQQELPEIAVNMLGASVDRTEEGTTVSFSAAIAENIIRALEARFGAENVSVGMITARAETLLASGANLRELELSGAYTPVKGLHAVTVLPENCYKKAYKDIFVKCAEDAIAVSGVTYYEFVDGEYVAVENVQTGTPLEGLFTKRMVDVYTKCGYYSTVLEGVTYYEKLDDGSYTVAGLEVGKPSNGYYTKSVEERYTACEGGVAEAGVTYYTVDAEGNYTEAKVELPQSVAEYYLADKEPIYALCEAGTYAEAGVIYYAKNADGTYTALPKSKIASSVSGYYVKDGETYVACAENALAVSGVTYYEKNGEEYVAVTGLVTVDIADGLYTLKNGVYTRCADGEYVLAGVTYYAPASFAVDENLEGVADENGNLIYTGSAIAMAKNYYKDTYSAIAYIKVHTETADYYFYADKAVSRSAVQVLYSAMNDVSTVRTDEHCYEVGDGTYSRYTAAQRKQFEKICNEGN